MVQIGPPDRRLPTDRPRLRGRRWSDDPDLKGAHTFAAKQVGAYLKKLRSEQAWSLEALARASGLHAATIEAIERADTDVQLSTLVRAFMPFGRQPIIGFLADVDDLVIPGYNRALSEDVTG